MAAEDAIRNGVILENTSDAAIDDAEHDDNTDAGTDDDGAALVDATPEMDASIPQEEPVLPRIDFTDTDRERSMQWEFESATSKLLPFSILLQGWIVVPWSINFSSRICPILGCQSI